MMKKLKKQSGFTLIETMIYIALFSIIIGGSVITFYSIIENSNKTQAQVILQEEANFIFRKLDWAITGASDITIPASGEIGTSLNLSKTTGDISFLLNGNKLQIREGLGVFDDLNNDSVSVSSLSFQNISGGTGLPKSIITTFTLNNNYGHSQTFNHNKYLKK